MKRIPLILVILLVIINFSSCERDDICVDGDTPFLIIGFFDFNDSTSFKEVPSLRIRAISNNAILGDNADESESFGFTDRIGVTDSIFIPLRLDNNSTSFEFIMDSADDDMEMENGNIDILGFSYTIGEQFVSRGCGFVANYNELDTLRTVSTEDWIRGIIVQENNVTNNPTFIHVKILH